MFPAFKISRERLGATPPKASPSQEPPKRRSPGFTLAMSYNQIPGLNTNGVVGRQTIGKHIRQAFVVSKSPRRGKKSLHPAPDSICVRTLGISR
jgi:hypothetical protein